MRISSTRIRHGILAVLSLAAFALLNAGARAQETPSPQSLSDDELRAAIKRLETEAAELIRSPDAPEDWKAILAAEDEMRSLDAEYMAQKQAASQRLNPLRQSQEAGDWQRRVYDLHGRLYTLQTEDARRVREAGLSLYRDRHAELSKLAPADTPELRRLGYDVLTYPRVDGSTSTLPLSTLIACRCFGAGYKWTYRNTEERWPDYGMYSEYFVPSPREPEYEIAEFTLRATNDDGQDFRLSAIVNGLLARNASTNAAYVNIIEGRSDIGLLARGPSPDELELARKNNVALDTVPFALDALVFIVNAENPVENITTQQLRDVYSGRIRSWREFGGSNEPIVAYRREENSGSEELMRERVMKDLPFEAVERGQEARLIQFGMGGPYEVLTRDPKGIAYSVFYYERFMAGSPRTRTIAVDGIAPTHETLAGRAYPHTTEVLVVTRKDLAPDAPAARLRDWLLSPEGQSVVRESGYVPIAP